MTSPLPSPELIITPPTPTARMSLQHARSQEWGEKQEEGAGPFEQLVLRETDGVKSELEVVLEESEWSRGICGWWEEPGRCVVSCCCPCIIYGKTLHRLAVLEETGEPSTSRGCCSSGCAIYCIIQLTVLGFIPDALLRPRVRTRYHLPGSLCSDLLLSGCCGPCVRVQMAREVSAEEERKWEERFPRARAESRGERPGGSEGMASLLVKREMAVEGYGK